MTEAQELYETINALTEGVAMFDADDMLVVCNQAFRDLTAPASQVLNDGHGWPLFAQALQWRGVYTEDGLNELERRISALINGDPSDDNSFDVPLQRSGHHRVRLRLTPSDGLVITLWDVSAERARADSLDETEAMMRKILETAPVGLVVYDLDAERMIFQTPQSKTLFGDLGQRLGSSWWDESKRADYLTELFATGAIDQYEVIGRNAKNEPFPAHLSARVVKHRGRSISVSSTHDLTQLHAQQAAVRLSRQRLLDAIEAIDLGFVLYDDEGRIVLWNSTFAALNAPVSEHLIEGARMEELQAYAQQMGHAGGAIGWTDQTYEFDLPDGRSFAAARSDMSDGGTVLTLRDITAAKAAAEELSRRREAAFQTEKLTALGELLAGVAHELNNPLSIVVGQALMLDEEVTDPTLSRRIGRISIAAERCSKIVKTFLAMARQQPFELQPVDINSVLETAIDVTSMGVLGSHVRFNVNLGEDLSLVSADEDQLTQVFTNLLVNATHAMNGQDQAKISVMSMQTRDQITVTCTDNGPGISDDLKARIFEPFYTTKDIGEGTGVGLALARQIVASHGGDITVTDAPGGGACFTVRLPTTREAASAEKEIQEVPSNGARVLVVEDEEDVADMIVEILTRDGFDVTHAASGRRAIDVLKDQRFDVIFSDLRMPGMTGRELLQRLKQSHPHLIDRMAFITGDAMSPDAEAMRQDTGVRLIEKPFSPTELRALVADVLKERTK